MFKTDKHEFVEMFRAYYNPLCNYANSILNNRSWSEDVVQDVFAGIWDKKNELKIESYKQYLFQSTRNKALEYLRKKSRQKDYVEDIKKDIINDYNITEEADKFMLKEKLFRSIRQLPPKCQKVFVMSKVNGLTYREIAQELDISVKTVENQIGRALRILRKKLVK